MISHRFLCASMVIQCENRIKAYNNVCSHHKFFCGPQLPLLVAWWIGECGLPYCKIFPKENLIIVSIEKKKFDRFFHLSLFHLLFGSEAIFMATIKQLLMMNLRTLSINSWNSVVASSDFIFSVLRWFTSCGLTIKLQRYKLSWTWTQFIYERGGRKKRINFGMNCVIHCICWAHWHWYWTMYGIDVNGQKMNTMKRHSTAFWVGNSEKCFSFSFQLQRTVSVSFNVVSFASGKVALRIIIHCTFPS